MVSDAREREAALDPARSFIVQAPAGSGKTELLVQRFLRLLKTVEHPESIVAITFTRKAAAEMRARVLDALGKAASEPKPEPEHERQTWLLAWEARKRGQSMDWRLEENPSRLRIQTIDSFCHSLTRRMPWLSRFGAPPETAEDASDLYRDAARRTMEGLERDEGWSGAIEKLLQHLDNDLPKVEGLIVGMLPRRDQWLRHIMDRPDRAELEQSLENAVRDGLRRAEASLPETWRARVFQLAAHAARNLRKDNFSSPIVNCEVAGADGFWLGIAELLLTKTGTLRKKVDKNTGFPAGDKRKPEMVALIEEMDLDPEPLADVRALPARSYSEEQWEVLEALFQLLKLASAQLRIVFRERRQTDFCEVAQGALLALGTDEQPTDLAYALDFRLQHLLVDEFQDTSYSQFQLLERLTAGWEPGDGRTLFLVGDPMQSIYRFREAEVGLFLRARAGGIGGLPLVPLTLKVNFRSQRPIVEWVNDAFDKALPVLEDAATGAVVYSPSEAHRADVPGAGVRVHAFAADDREAEAERVVNLIKDARAAEPRQKIAILVRARTHAPHIVDRLKREGIRFLATEMDPMSSRPMVGDLWALTRALLHPADRIAWLAVLRAPWCGLNLDELLTLVENDAETPLWDLMRDAARAAGLSAGGRRRLERVTAALEPVLAGR